MLLPAVEKIIVRVPESGGVSTASILVAVGAVLAAVITAIAAQRRHKRSLLAERERLQDQLRAQEEHQERELESLREHLELQIENEHLNRDLDELRSRIDAAVDAGEKMLSTILNSKASLVTGGKEEAKSEQEQVVGQFLDLSGLVRRVMLRLGAKDAFVVLLSEYKDRLAEMNNLVLAELEDEDDDREFPEEDWHSVLEQTALAHRKVIDTATERFGSRIREDARS